MNDDLISRQEAIRIAEQGQVQGYEWQFKELVKLPSVNPQKTQMIDKSNFDQEQYNADLQCAYDCGKASVNPQEPSGETVSLEVFKQVMWERDIAIEQLKELGYEFGEKIDDKPIRQSVIEDIKAEIKEWYWQADKQAIAKDPCVVDAMIDLFIRTINAHISGEPKTGHWEWVQYDYNPKLGNWHCSECRCIVVECVDKEEKGGIPLYKYCPQCGAKMVESQDSESKRYMELAKFYAYELRRAGLAESEG